MAWAQLNGLRKQSADTLKTLDLSSGKKPVHSDQESCYLQPPQASIVNRKEHEYLCCWKGKTVW